MNARSALRLSAPRSSGNDAGRGSRDRGIAWPLALLAAVWMLLGSDLGSLSAQESQPRVPAKPTTQPTTPPPTTPSPTTPSPTTRPSDAKNPSDVASPSGGAPEKDKGGAPEEGSEQRLPPAPLPQELQSIVAKLGAAEVSVEELTRMIGTLCESGNKDVLPHVAKVLASHDDPKVQRAAVVGVSRHLPAEASEFFFELIAKGTPSQKQAALYAMAHVNDIRVYEVLEPILTQPGDKEMMAAAYYGPAVRGRMASRMIMQSTYGMMSPQPDDAIARALEEIAGLGRLLTSIAKSKASSAQAQDLIRRFGDRSVVEAEQATFLSTLSEQQARELAPLKKFFRANHRWLGRTTIPDVDGVSYTLVMENLAAAGKEPKRVDVQANARQLLISRNESSGLDRGCQLDLASDVLMSIPRVCSPELAASDESTISIAIKIPDTFKIRAGVGFSGTRYWEGRLESATHAVITIDKLTGAPTQEEVFDASGSSLAVTKFGGFRELTGGGYVPTSIEAQLKQARVGNKFIFMEYTCNYAVARGEVWIPVDVTALEKGEHGVELRAISHIENVNIREEPEQ